MYRKIVLATSNLFFSDHRGIAIDPRMHVSLRETTLIARHTLSKLYYNYDSTKTKPNLYSSSLRTVHVPCRIDAAGNRNSEED